VESSPLTVKRRLRPRAAIGGILLIGILLPASYRLWQETELRIALRLRLVAPPAANPTIVMLGDSLTQLADWPSLTGCHRIANFGVGGHTTSQMLARIPEIIAIKPDLVFLMGGSNDALRGLDMTRALENIHLMKVALEATGIETVILQPPPLKKMPTALAGIQNAATLSINWDYGDLLVDGVHLRKSGYLKWRNAIKPTIDRFC
jgi:lysophospholipase L1-like esterase